MRRSRAPTPRVYDLYAPLTLEQPALDAREARDRDRSVLTRRLSSRRSRSRQATRSSARARSSATSGSARWRAPAASTARLRRDPSLRTLIDVVPFGIDPSRPSPGPALRGVVGDRRRTGSCSGRRDLELVRPAHRDPRRRTDRRSGATDVRLYFLGVKHPNPEDARDGDGGGGRRARGRARRSRPCRVLQLRLGPVRRARPYLLDADLAVSAHFDDIETRFAFRTRLLDCLWAGLPVVPHGATRSAT